MTPLAHAGHWLVQLLYLAPLVIAVGVLGYQALTDRRALKHEGAEAQRAPAGDEAQA